MFRQPLRTVFALAVLATAAAVPAVAQNSMPAGYERMMYPDVPYGTDSWTWNRGTTYFSSKTSSTRVTDLEVVEVSKNELYIRVVEVPIDSELACEKSVIVTDEYDFWWFINNDNLRPTDLEFYYGNPGGGVVPLYAYVAVENIGKDFSPWQWVPPTPYNAFMNELDQKYEENWRPYDIEFTRDENGDVVGTALLAPILTAHNDGTMDYVPTKWEWFLPPDLADYEDEDWQLLDVEVPIEGLDDSTFGDGLNLYHDLGFRFGIFVDTSFITAKDTEVTLATNTEELHYLPRLIDLEPDVKLPQECNDSWFYGEICQAGSYQLYTAAWLNGK